MLKFNIHEKYSFYKNKGLSGLANLGNTCYMNSIIQCLSNILPLTHHLLTMKVNDNNLVQMYTKVLMGIWKENSPVAPKSFKKCLDVILPKYSDNKQHDAHEFLLDFVEILHKFVLVKELKFKTSINSSKYIKQATESWYNHINKPSVISELFYGQYMKKFTCNDCNYHSRKYEAFLSLDLYCDKNDKSISELIKDNFMRDYVYFTCENCGNENRDIEHELDTEIFKFPSVMIISLKRFKVSNGKMTKILNAINVDDILDFSEYTCISEDESVIYDLQGIVCHIGNSLNSGHYFTLIKDQEWICFNDINVKKYDITKLDKAYPYILFYNRRN